MKMKKFLSFLGNVVTVLILIVAVVMTVAIISSTRDPKMRVPNLFGYAALSVQTDSMESEDGFYVGDLIIDRLLDQEEAEKLSVGDVITFRRQVEDQVYLETHRIVPYEPKNRGEEGFWNEVEDGVWKRLGESYYTTRGDNTPDVDRVYGTDDVEYVGSIRIIGIWTGIRIPKLGAALDFLRTSMGFMICIVIPVALFFIYQLYVFIMTLTRRQKEKAMAEVADKEAELKAKAVAEFLAQQQAAGGDASAPDTPAGTAPPAEGAQASAEPASEPAAETAAPADEPAPAEAPEAPAEEKPAEEKSADISDEEKDRIIREYLAKQSGEKKDE